MISIEKADGSEKVRHRHASIPIPFHISFHVIRGLESMGLIAIPCHAISLNKFQFQIASTSIKGLIELKL